MKGKQYKERLAELKTHPKKSLGQNFLVNEAAIAKIAAEVKKVQPQTLIEVGPGLGALTEPLLGVCPSENSFYIELDHSFATYWREEGLQVIEGDALQISWQTFMKSAAPRVLVSNLPYQISARLVVERCLDAIPLDFMVLMFQKEVAQRITAKADTADYGLLSVVAQSFWQCEKILDLGTHDFFPPPSVASRVLKFSSREGPVHWDRTGYLNFLKLAFKQPRKILISNLATLGPVSKLKVSEFSSSQGLSEKIRPGSLTVGQFQLLFSVLQERPSCQS